MDGEVFAGRSRPGIGRELHDRVEEDFLSVVSRYRIGGGKRRYLGKAAGSPVGRDCKTTMKTVT
jgi:hypothetical protein